MKTLREKLEEKELHLDEYLQLDNIKEIHPFNQGYYFGAQALATLLIEEIDNGKIYIKNREGDCFGYTDISIKELKSMLQSLEGIDE